MSKEHNKLFYYFNTNLGSIQGRITSGFLITLMMGVVLLFLNNILWWQTEYKKEVILSQMRPIQSESIKFMDITRKTQANMIRYAYLKDRKYERENAKYWLVDIPAQKDTLWHYVKIYDNAEVKLLYTEVNKYLGELKQQQRFLERSLSTGQDQAAIKQQIENDLLHAQTELEKSIQNLINRVYQNEKKLVREIDKDKQRNNVILGISALLGFLMAYGLGIFLFTRIFKWIREVRNFLSELNKGNFPEDIPPRENEFKNISNYANQLKQKLEELNTYAEEVAAQNLQNKNSLFRNEGILGKHLQKMQHTLQQFSREERQRVWAGNGISTFSEILRNHDEDIQALSRQIISKLVEYMDAVQGAMFLLSDEETFFELMATYASGREKFIQRKISVHEGLLGRVYHEKGRVYLEEIPENYTNISSGLGNTLPNTILLLPLIDENQRLQGAIELASLKKFEPYEINFLETLCTHIASTVLVINTYLSNQKLLNEFQKNTENLQEKEQEARKISLDLQNARKEIEHQLHEVHRENEKLNAVLSNIMEAIVIANAQGRIEVFNQASEKLFGWKTEEVIGKNIKILMPAIYSKEHEQYMENYLNTKEKKIIGIGRIVEGKHKDGHIFPVHLAVTEVNLNDEHLFAAIFRRSETD